MNSNAYAPPKAHVADVDPTEGIVLAGRGMRLLAAILDGIIMGVMVYGPLLLSGDIQAASARALSTNDPLAIYGGFFGKGGMFAFVGFVIWCVITYMLVQRNGQTI